MPKVQTDYSNTIIYKLCCRDTTISDIYIGHTTNFIKRKNHHKLCINDDKYDRYVYKFIRDNGGWDNWTMVQLQECNCKNKREAEAVEHDWIQNLEPSLNTNKPYAKCKEEPQKYKQDWYEENKEEILEKAKDRYNNNKEIIKQKVKQYAEENKEQIAEKQKIYREKNKEKLSEQKKIYREQNKEQASIKQKEWREANKDKIKEKKGEIIECECGSRYTFGNKYRHLQSNVHTSYQEQLCQPVLTEEEQLKLEEENKRLEEEKIKYTKIKTKNI